MLTHAVRKTGILLGGMKIVRIAQILCDLKTFTGGPQDFDRNQGRGSTEHS